MSSFSCRSGSSLNYLFISSKYLQYLLQRLLDMGRGPRQGLRQRGGGGRQLCAEQCQRGQLARHVGALGHALRPRLRPRAHLHVPPRTGLRFCRLRVSVSYKYRSHSHRIKRFHHKIISVTRLGLKGRIATWYRHIRQNHASDHTTVPNK